ncbi:hypothetical protein VTJ49DRAFT_919 [Mycothermus thermophilus]|uniref:Uncharacterized protein n=1 Tax=Humicola insolens TaxID=85995 RepID=A0ABR3VER2_HUMIN
MTHGHGLQPLQRSAQLSSRRPPTHPSSPPSISHAYPTPLSYSQDHTHSILPPFHPFPPLLQLLPLHRPKLAQRLQLAIPQLDARRANHARIDAQRGRQVLVGFGPGIVAQHEVVALGIPRLVARDGPREVEDAPVGHVADHAALAEDELACGEDDSVRGLGLVCRSGERRE